MKDFKELQELVGRRGFGTALYGNINGDPVYLSRGIREFFLDGDNIQKIIAAVDGFQKGEFGLAQSRGKLRSEAMSTAAMISAVCRRRTARTIPSGFTGMMMPSLFISGLKDNDDWTRKKRNL